MASLLSVLVIAIALSLPVGLYLGLSQLQSFSRQLSSAPQLSIFLVLDANSGDAAAIEQTLRADAEVGAYRFIPRAQALSDLKRNAGIADVLDNLKQNPLPDAFVVTTRGNRPETLERLRDEAKAWPKVAHVQLDSEWARRLDAALRFGRTSVAVLGFLLAAALVAVTFNTIRLQILTRRDEIEVSKLIGATNPFIRRPFLWFGALQGLAGGILAWIIVRRGRPSIESRPDRTGSAVFTQLPAGRAQTAGRRHFAGVVCPARLAGCVVVSRAPPMADRQGIAEQNSREPLGRV